MVPIATTLPGFEVRSWIGIAAPAATPAPVIARLEGAINKALLSAQVREQLGFLGVKPEGSTPEGMKAFVVGEIERWKRVVRASGIEQL